MDVVVSWDSGRVSVVFRARARGGVCALCGGICGDCGAGGWRLPAAEELGGCCGSAGSKCAPGGGLCAARGGGRGRLGPSSVAAPRGGTLLRLVLTKFPGALGL